MWDWSSYILYFIAFSSSFILLDKYDVKKESRSINLIIGLLPLFLLMGLRGPEVGNDLVRYNNHIVNPDDEINLFSLSEPVFALLYKLSNICGGLHFFIICTSFLQGLFVYYGCKCLHHHGIRVALIVLLFYGAVSIRSYSMVRNGLAVAISFFAFSTFIYPKNYNKRYWLSTILGIGVHNTTVINIPAYLICKPFNILSKQRIKKEIIIRSIYLTIVTFLLFILAKSQMMDILQTINEGKYAGFEQTEKSSGIGNFIIRIPLLFIIIIHFKILWKNYNRNFLPYLMLMIFDIAVAQMKYISQNFERFTMFTQIGEVMMIGLLMQCLIKKYGKPMKFCAYLIGILYASYYLFYWSVFGGLGAGNGNMPYKFWF